MNHPYSRPIVLAAAGTATALLAACSSTVSGHPSGPQSASGVGPSRSTTSPASVPSGSLPSSGGPTAVPPPVKCLVGTVTLPYDGADPNPTELCLLIRDGFPTHARLLIKPPAGATWALPTLSPQSAMVGQASRSGATVIMDLTPVHKGTATVAVPRTSWHLRVAVSSQ
jgi:hypothetical protein